MPGFYLSMKVRNQSAVYHNSNKTSFKSIYALRGNTKDINAAKKMFEELISTHDYQFKLIKNDKDVLTIGVATGENDVKKVNQNDFSGLALKNVIKAKELIDPFKTLRFAAFPGTVISRYQFEKDGKTFITRNSLSGDSSITLIKFDEPKTLINALKELAEIPYLVNFEDKSFIFSNKNIKELLEYSDDLENCPDFKKMKIKGLCGMGTYSTVLELPNNYCLKLSFNPNAPLKDEVYDIPTILKRKVEMKYPLYDSDDTLKYIYYTVQKKGFNKNEYYIKPKHVRRLKELILKTNPSSEIVDYDTRQIAILKGKPYLIDSSVVVNREFYT